MTQQTMTDQLPVISIQTDVAKQKARPFLAEIVSDTLQPGKYDGVPYQWVIAVKPLTFQIGGKTGAFWEYIGIKTAELNGEIKEQSKFGRHFNAFKNVFGTDEDIPIGQGRYVGRQAMFIKDEVNYGTDKTTGEAIVGKVLLPVAPPDPALLEQAGLVAPAPKAVELSADDADRVLLALDGTPRSQIQKKAFQAKLGNAITQGVGRGDGPVIQALVDLGLATFDGETFRRLN